MNTNGCEDKLSTRNLFTTAVIFNNGIPFKTSGRYTTRRLLSQDSLVEHEKVTSHASFLLSRPEKNVEHIKNSLFCSDFASAFVPETFGKGGC